MGIFLRLFESEYIFGFKWLSNEVKSCSITLYCMKNCMKYLKVFRFENVSFKIVETCRKICSIIYSIPRFLLHAKPYQLFFLVVDWRIGKKDGENSKEFCLNLTEENIELAILVYYLENYNFSDKTIFHKLSLDFDAKEDQIINFEDVLLKNLIFGAFLGFISFVFLGQLVSKSHGKSTKVRIPELGIQPNLSVEILLIREFPNYFKSCKSHFWRENFSE